MKTLTRTPLRGISKQEQPRKLSKAGQWMRDNPKGIITVIDRRAVNR